MSKLVQISQLLDGDGNLELVGCGPNGTYSQEISLEELKVLIPEMEQFNKWRKGE